MAARSMFFPKESLLIQTQYPRAEIGMQIWIYPSRPYLEGKFAKNVSSEVMAGLFSLKGQSTANFFYKRGLHDRI